MDRVTRSGAALAPPVIDLFCGTAGRPDGSANAELNHPATVFVFRNEKRVLYNRSQWAPQLRPLSRTGHRLLSAPTLDVSLRDMREFLIEIEAVAVAD